MEIGRAAQIGVGHGGTGFFCRQRLGIEAVRQDRFDAAVAAGIDREGAFAGGLQARLTEAFTQTQNAEAGAVALFRMPPCEENGFNQLRRGRSRLFRPTSKPLRGPAGEAMVRRHGLSTVLWRPRCSILGWDATR